MSETETKTIVLYDGVCGLCNGLIQFLLKRDTKDRFRFASLQSEFSAGLLRRHHLDARDLDTVYVAINYRQPNERVLARSDAIIHVGRQLGGIWQVAQLGQVLPHVFRDWLYNLVARHRYRVFGKHDTCMLPEERFRRKFLDTPLSS